MLVPFARLARRLPGRREGKHLHPAALYRWARTGLRAPDGSRVRLEAERVGGQWCTTWRRVRRFFAALQGEPVEARPVPSRRERARAAAEAERVLDELGVRRRK